MTESGFSDSGPTTLAAEFPVPNRSAERSPGLTCAHLDGFDLHANVAVAADDDLRRGEGLISRLPPLETLSSDVVDAVRPALLLADLYWPGGRVAVDGGERTMLRADYLLRGVAVGPGTHTIRFWYTPRVLWLRAVMSAATLPALAAGTFRTRRAGPSTQG